MSEKYSKYLQKLWKKKEQEADRLANGFWFNIVSHFMKGDEPQPIGTEEEKAIAEACFTALIDHTIGFHMKKVRGEAPRPLGLIFLKEEKK